MGALTLFQAEAELEALIDTEPLVQDPEQRKAIEAEIVSAHLATVAKRDSFCEFLAALEFREQAITKRVAELNDLRRHYASVRERLEDYAAHGIKAMGKDEKGKFRTLAGNISALSVRKCPASVEVTNEQNVPDKYKTVTITVAAEDFNALMDAVDLDTAMAFAAKVKKTEVDVSKTAIKTDIQAGAQVDGAELVTNKYKLRRE